MDKQPELPFQWPLKERIRSRIVQNKRKIIRAIAVITLLIVATLYARKIASFSSLSELDAKYWLDISDIALLVSAVLVTFGLFGEFSDSETWKKTGWYEAAKWVVIIGIVIELLGDAGVFQSGKRIQEVQDDKISELEKALRGREIDQAAFIKSLAGKSKAPIDLVYLKENGEVFSLALQIQRALRNARWVVSEPKPLSPKEMSDLYENWVGQPAQAPAAGVAIDLRVNATNPSLETMVSVMNEAPVSALLTAFEVGFGEKWSPRVFAASVWQPNAPPHGTIQIAVGPKP